MTSEEARRKGVGRNLRLARERSGLKQSEVAKLVRLSRQAVIDHEGGKGDLGDERLAAYAAIYGVTVQTLRYAGVGNADLSVADAAAALDVAWENLRSALARTGALPTRPPEAEG